jgi:hypothetical protein
MDSTDLERKTARMRAAWEIGPHDLVVNTMMGINGDRYI